MFPSLLSRSASTTHQSLTEYLDNEAIAWLCLSFCPGVGPKTIGKILSQNKSALDVFAMNVEQQKVLGISRKSSEYLSKHDPSNPDLTVQKTLAWVHADQHHIVTLNHKSYPSLLKHIDTAPPVIMVKGQLSALTLPSVAIVGSRHPTSSGQQQAYDMASALAQSGLNIVSGLAKGVDAIAHQAAVDAQASTVAVVGTGLDIIYPKENAKLFEAICEKGAVVSEFPLGTPARAGHFPRRNRIVSGMSLGTLVIEAHLKSGSLITARQALEQNRQVFAVPGPISNPQKSGCHHLIRQGALLVESAEHVLDDLYPMVGAVNTQIEQATKSDRPISDDPVEQTLLKALDYDGVGVDELVARSGLSVADVTAILMMFELKGWVLHEAGNYSLR